MKDLVIGIVGLDNWYHGMPFTTLAATTPGVRLKALADMQASRLTWVNDRFPGVVTASDYEAVLTDPEIDAVIVMSPTAAHAGHAVLAARHGKHLLCDKPLGIGTADAKRILDAYSDGAVRAATIFGRRGRPLYQQARQWIAEGRIGRPLAAVETGRFGLPRAMSDSADPGWYATPALSGGGGFLDHCVHQLDALRFMVGGNVAKASGRTARLLREVDAEDYGIGTAVFDNGFVATIESSWISDGPPTSVLSIEGTAGSLRLEDAALKTLTLRNGDRELTLADKPGRFVEGEGWRLGMNGYSEVFANFVAMARDGAAPLATLEDGFKAVDLAERVYASSRL